MIVMRSLGQERWNQLWTFFFFLTERKQQSSKEKKNRSCWIGPMREGRKTEKHRGELDEKRRRKWRKDGRSRAQEGKEVSQKDPELQVRMEREQGQPRAPSSWGIWPLGPCGFVSFWAFQVWPQCPAGVSEKPSLDLSLFLFFGRFCLPSLSAPGLRPEPSIYILNCARWMWTSPTLPVRVPGTKDMTSCQNTEVCSPPAGQVTKQGCLQKLRAPLWRQLWVLAP